jgi:enediyne polyketide synthase
VLGAAAELPGRLAVHGRVGLRAPRPIARAAAADPAATGRFTERVLVHYPGVELIAEATLDTTTDPYLTDYVVDGASMLPPTIAIEAMAQAASALAGAPTRSATDVSMAVPIVLPGPHAPTIRLCALAAGDAVTVILRCESTGFAVDHFRGTFQPATAPTVSQPGQAPEATGTIKAGDLYGPVCFQVGRFKRLTTVRFAGSKAATGVLDTAAEEPWWLAKLPPLLGSPAVTDAALQLAQACVPHQRLMFAGWTSATFTGRGATEVVELHAVEVTEQAESSWDVDAIDSEGQLVACFRGLVMREAEPLPRTSPWPVALAGCFIERAAAELGLGPGLEVRLDRRSTAHGRRDVDGWVRASAADSGPPGLVLRVRAGGQVACGWRTAKHAGRKGGTADGAERWLKVLGDQRAWRTSAVDGATRALAAAMASCAGQGADPRDMSVKVRQVGGTEWLLVRADSGSMACAGIDLAGTAYPVAIAIRTGGLDVSRDNLPAEPGHHVATRV